VTPPERPTAPKPVQLQHFPASAFNMPQDAVLGMPGSLVQPSVMGMPQLPTAEAPKLKDFLPFMKPGSFGSKAPVVSNDCAPGSAGSLPASVSASPVHLPQTSVSFPPSPQRQPPASLPTSNGYDEMSQAAGRGFVHADAGYPVAEALLSPTAPPGAPRAASPAHQQPPMAAHPGGPGDSQPQSYMYYNIPHNQSQSSVNQNVAPASTGMLPVSASSHVDGTVQNSQSSGLQGDVPFTGQPSVINNPVYSSHGLSQPAVGAQTQHSLPGNLSSVQNHVPGQFSQVSAPAAAPPSIGAHPQPTGLPRGTPVMPANWNQSYPAGPVPQHPDLGTAMPGVPVNQVNSFSDVRGPYSSAGGARAVSDVEASKPHYLLAAVVMPSVCTGVPLPYQSAQPGTVQPPSYEVVAQHCPPSTKLIHQPGLTGPVNSVHVHPGLPPAGPATPMQTPYPGVGSVRQEVRYGTVHSGHVLPGSQHPSVTAMPQRPSFEASMPPPHAVTQQSFTGPHQRPLMPVSAAYMDQQPRYISQDQPRYPPASQTGPSHHHAAAVQPQYPAPMAHPQPRYPAVSSTSQPFPGGTQPAYQSTSQHPVASPVQPMHTTASYIQHTLPGHQQQYIQRHPVQPNRPTEAHASSNLPQPRYPGTNQVYPASNQPASGYRQPLPVDSQQQIYQAFPGQQQQQQPMYQAGPSQPPVVSQSAAQTPYVNQHQPHINAPYNSHNVISGPAAADIVDIPVCLPSPLQPSRATGTAAVEVSKNIDSIRDLDLTGKTSSSEDDVQPKQDVSGVRASDVDSAESKDVSSSASESQEKTEEEARCSLHQSRSSRDVYADPDSVARFVADVEKFQKHVDSLVKPTLGGYFPLDKEWKV